MAGFGHHVFQDGIEDLAGLLGVAVRQQLHGGVIALFPMT